VPDIGADMIASAESEGATSEASGKLVSRGAYWRYDRQGADNRSVRLPEMWADLPSYPKAPAQWRGRTV
jgi:hypothetical protein